MAKDIAPEPDPREMDMLLTAGERIAMALLGDRDQRAGVPGGVSYTGSQAGIITDTRTARPRSSRSGPSGSSRRSGAGNVVIIAGFQGLSDATRSRRSGGAAPT